MRFRRKSTVEQRYLNVVGAEWRRLSRQQQHDVIMAAPAIGAILGAVAMSNWTERSSWTTLR